MGKRTEESRHYSQIWEKAIWPEVCVVEEECDAQFCAECAVRKNPLPEWKRALENEYRALRENLKERCYGDNAGNGSLDARKLAAIFCKALMKKKAFQYDTKKALPLVQAKQRELSPVAFNCWAVNNILINYKLAYYVSLQLVYLTLLEQLLSSYEGAKVKSKAQLIKEQSMAKCLNNHGHLYRYPFSPDADSFDVNVIIGMARADYEDRDFDLFLFAMQLYQIEMYTMERLKNEQFSA